MASDEVKVALAEFAFDAVSWAIAHRGIGDDPVLADYLLTVHPISELEVTIMVTGRNGRRFFALKMSEDQPIGAHP